MYSSYRTVRLKLSSRLGEIWTQTLRQHAYEFKVFEVFFDLNIHLYTLALSTAERTDHESTIYSTKGGLLWLGVCTTSINLDILSKIWLKNNTDKIGTAIKHKIKPLIASVADSRDSVLGSITPAANVTLHRMIVHPRYFTINAEVTVDVFGLWCHHKNIGHGRVTFFLCGKPSYRIITSYTNHTTWDWNRPHHSELPTLPQLTHTSTKTNDYYRTF